MPDVRLGEVTCPSGVLLLVDFGLLGLWSGDQAPLMPEWAAPAWMVEIANHAVDFEVVGPDAKAAALLYGESSGYLYDRDADFEAAFEERVREEGLDASLRALDERVPHVERVVNAVRGVEAAGCVELHGAWVACVAGVPQDVTLEVFGEPHEGGADEGRWSAVSLRVPGAAPTVETRSVGTVTVDCARLAFMDVAAVAAWQHTESADGRADYAFWGEDAADVARQVGAPALEGAAYGWADLPEARARELAEPIEALHASDTLRLVTDFRPHSDHYRLLEPIRASPTESATVSVGHAQVCGFMTTWGDGSFDVERDVDAAGRLVALRVRFVEG